MSARPLPSVSAEAAVPPAARPIWRMMLGFFIPLFASNLLQALGGTLNSIFVGRLIGQSAIAAYSAFFPVYFLLFTFVIGLASGAAVLVGQAFGAGAFERMREVAATTMLAAIALGLVVGTFGGALVEPLLRLMGTPADILQGSIAYARVALLSLPIACAYITLTSILRGTRDAHTPLVALIAMTLVGAALTPALVLGWFGPRLGVEAAAWSSAMSFTIGWGGLSLYLIWRGHPLAPDRAFLRRLRFDFKTLGLVLRLGLPTAVQIVMISLSELAVLALVNRFGSTATAAYGAVIQIINYVQFPAMSMGITASVFGAQAIGAGRQERLGAILKSALGLNFAIVGGAVLLVYIFSRDVLGWFLVDPTTVETAHRLLTITLWSYVVFGTSGVLGGMMRASGTVLWPTVISIAAIWGVQVPVAYALASRIGLEGVWWGYPIAYVVALTGQTTFLLLVWRRRQHTRLI